MKLISTVVLNKPNITDFSMERNAALKKAKTPWVFFADSDEKVTQELEREILEQVQNDKYIGFYVKRDDFFLGKWLKHGETASVRLLRLAKKEAGLWQGNVHEIWKVTGPTATLANHIKHYSHPTISGFITKINQYTGLIDDEKFSLFELFVYPTIKFVQNYFLRFGFLDGFAGFVMAYMMSLQSLITRVKRYETGLDNNS